METELVNLFIQKQSQLVTELTNKNLMAESKFQLLEGKYNNLLTSHSTLTEQNNLMRQRLVEYEQVVAAYEAAREQPPLDDFATEDEPAPPKVKSNGKQSHSA